MHRAIRILGTVAVTALLTYPWWAPEWGKGLIGEVVLLPLPFNVFVVVGFFGMVALYCATLQRMLIRAGSPRSATVWWMFAIPANFVEDFYIIHRVSTAISPRIPMGSWQVWNWFGFGWCAFQILSLFPAVVGLIGGGIALALWLTHWVLSLVLLRKLR